MRRLISILILTGLLASLPLWAQRTPVYECWVLENGEDGSAYVALGVAKDSRMIFRNRFVLEDLNAVKNQCRAEIARLQGKDARPIPTGRVNLTEPPPPPVEPPPPTQEDLDLAAFLSRVEIVRKLAVIVPADDADLAALRLQIASDLKAHPEWKDAL